MTFTISIFLSTRNNFTLLTMNTLDMILLRLILQLSSIKLDLTTIKNSILVFNFPSLLQLIRFINLYIAILGTILNLRSKCLDFYVWWICTGRLKVCLSLMFIRCRLSTLLNMVLRKWSFLNYTGLWMLKPKQYIDYEI